MYRCELGFLLGVRTLVGMVGERAREMERVFRQGVYALLKASRAARDCSTHDFSCHTHTHTFSGSMESVFFRLGNEFVSSFSIVSRNSGRFETRRKETGYSCWQPKWSSGAHKPRGSSGFGSWRTEAAIRMLVGGPAKTVVRPA